MSNELKLAYLDPEELQDHPENWRIHDDYQMNALDDFLDEVGWAGAALFNKRTKRILDGHARKRLAKRRGEKIPVLIGDWSEEDEAKILASLDPLGSLAGMNKERFNSLFASVKTDSKNINEMLSKMAGGLKDSIHALVTAPASMPASAAPDAAPESPKPDPKPRPKNTAPPAPATPPPSDFNTPTSKTVQLYMNSDTFPEFQEMLTALARRYGTDNATDTVVAAVREVYRSLK